MNINVLYSSEMIAPLDVYHNTAGVTVPNEERQRRYRHHRTQHKHRHRHPGFQFDPNNAEVSFHLTEVLLNILIDFLLHSKSVTLKKNKNVKYEGFTQPTFTC